jgi:CRISPR-associated protein Cas1
MRKDNTLRFFLYKEQPEFLFSEEETPLEEDTAVLSKRNLPVEVINAIYLFNETRLNTKLLNFLAQKKILLHTFNYYGHHTGTFFPHAEQLSGDLVIAQGKAFSDDKRRLAICRAIVDAKLHNQLSVLQYYQRKKMDTRYAVDTIKELKQSLAEVESPEQIMGLEGFGNRIYYGMWHLWLFAAGDSFSRVYHPPDNPVNAMLSFLNSLLYTAMVGEMYRTALYPGISYLHSPQTRRFSLVLDLVEPFKPLMVDRLLFRLFGQKEISSKDFKEHSNGVLLTDNARKIVLKAWDNQLKTTVKYPALKRSVSYRQLLRLDCYKLIKHLLEEKHFQPYKITW